MSFTQYVGDGGIQACRVVRPGGKIKFEKEWLQHDKLLPFVGNVVYCLDYCDGDVHIHIAEYFPYSTIKRKKPKPYYGKLIVIIKGGELCNE